MIFINFYLCYYQKFVFKIFSVFFFFRVCQYQLPIHWICIRSLSMIFHWTTMKCLWRPWACFWNSDWSKPSISKKKWVRNIQDLYTFYWIRWYNIIYNCVWFNICIVAKVVQLINNDNWSRYILYVYKDIKVWELGNKLYFFNVDIKYVIISDIFTI